jgi:hypothetical protein
MRVRMVFQAYDIDHASLAGVPRCAIVAFDPAVVPWRARRVVAAADHGGAARARAFLARQIDAYVPALVQFLGEVWLAVDVRRNSAVPNILSLLNVYLPIMPRPDGVPLDGTDPSADALPHTHHFAPFANRSSVPVLEPEDISAVFERVFLFCTVSAFGGLLDDTGRSASDCFLRDRTDLRGSTAAFPQRRTVFDFFPDLAYAAWAPWTDGSAPVCDRPIDRQFVPTAETVPPLFLRRLVTAAHIRTLLVDPEKLTIDRKSVV